MENGKMPERIARITPGEPFSFRCHPQISCFTDCCRHLELALTPYDVLRLRQATKCSSAELHEKYLIREQTAEDVFPHFYLTMVDDGRSSCAFVTSSGCSIYEHRPSACRTYPLGRAAIRRENDIDIFYVLLQEPHCHGFHEPTIQTATSFCRSQELETYNHFNDLIIAIQQHEKIRQGMRLTRKEADAYSLALYDIDTFRKRLKDGTIETYNLIDKPEQLDNDEELLRISVSWLKIKLFGESGEDT
ncbi:MAG: zinc/iron-chelating domain-containing protein [Proteobacteria bacterium]|nr:MAG: zinc/iron-chelating domain-containing protein [Pseudomonadota bacterium]PIE65299.1 MAG: zinc/iron-chelating domain-containing protein [Desulfobacterales bacterium]